MAAIIPWQQHGMKFSGRIKSIEEHHAEVVLQDGGVVHCLVNLSALSEVPQVGQQWLVEQVSHHFFVLVSRLDSAKRVNALDLAMEIDPDSLLNNERVVVDNLVQWGMDSIVVDVTTSDGELHYPSSIASDYGLSVTSDVLSNVIWMAQASGLKVYVRYAKEMFGSNPDYCQAERTSESPPYHSVTTRNAWSPYLSKDAVAALVDELFTLYPSLDGIILGEVGYLDPECGWEQEFIDAYYEEYGDYPPTIWIGTEAWRDPDWIRWNEFRGKAWVDWTTTIDAAVPEGKRMVVFCPDAAYSQYDSDSATTERGRYFYGLMDDFGDKCAADFVGCSNNGVSSWYGTDESEQAVSAEWVFALSERLGRQKGAFVLSPVEGLDVTKHYIKSAKEYETRMLCLNGYAEYLSNFTEDERDDLFQVIESVRVRRAVSRRHVGVVLSTNTREIGFNCVGTALYDPDDVNGVEYQQHLQRQFSLLRQNLPSVRLHIVFDEDLQSLKAFGLDALLLVSVRCLSDEACDAVLAWAERDDKNIIAIGTVGVFDAQTTDTKSTFPFFDWFPFTSYNASLAVADYYATVTADAPMMSGTTIPNALSVSVDGAQPTGYLSDTANVDGVWLMTGRSSHWCPDLFIDATNRLDVVAWRLVSLAVGQGTLQSGDGS